MTGHLFGVTVTLLDSGEGVQLTRANILRAIGDPVRGARQGDRFFFHYCGHATQIENWSNSEEDGMDECLVPVDGEAHEIMDNIGSHPCCRLFPRRHTINRNSELRRHLIDAPPPAPPSSPCLTRATAGQGALQHPGFISFLLFLVFSASLIIPCPATFPAPSSHFLPDIFLSLLRLMPDLPIPPILHNCPASALCFLAQISTSPPVHLLPSPAPLHTPAHGAELAQRCFPLILTR
ncbi:hypothetical protein B0H13DRAFT_2339705 [Mycena leptocephala]|nr:hypothetical protein B0H13DRAFT_2339705 [Mycena leptocephala]